MAAFSELKSELDAVRASIVAASVDSAEKAAEVQKDLSFPVAFGVTREQANGLGSWWEERRSIVQPSEFILNSDGDVVSATYSTGPIGRVMPEDVVRMINFIEKQKKTAS